MYLFKAFRRICGGGALYLAAAASVAGAQAEAPPDIDAQGRPGKIALSAFAQGLELGGARLSETGKRLAIAENVNGSQMVRVYDADTLQLLKVIDGGKTGDFNWFAWAGDDRVLLSVMRETDNANYWARMARLLVFDIRNDSLSYVGLERASIDGDTVIHIDPAGDHVLLSYRNQARFEAEVWRLPLDGSGSANAERIVDNEGDIRSWVADSAGVVRLGLGRSRRGSLIVVYRASANEEFRRVTKIDRHDRDAMEAWDVFGLTEGSDLGYSFEELEDGRSVVREFDFRTGEQGEIAYEHSDWSIQRILTDHTGVPGGMVITDDRPRHIWFDPKIAALQDELAQALGGREVRIIANAHNRRMLVLQTGADDPGALYVFTPAEQRLAFFANLRPDIDFRLLSAGTAHDIPTRDGKSMRSYLTLPRGRGKSNLPLVVMPHGGPYGVRDTLEYDDWVQLLANRGYAVLQPNFRGSGGFGAAFEKAGDGEIGRRMQDDLDDATNWAVAQGYADPARVCMAGGSYGGYAAMWAVIRNPEIYRCAVSWAGVADWDAIMAYDRDTLTRRYYKETWKPKLLGNDNSFDFSDVSPMAQIGRLSRPLLIAHGRFDERVPYSQHYRLVEKAGRLGVELETLVLDEMHSPGYADNHEKLLDAMVSFLERHNPPD